MALPLLNRTQLNARSDALSAKAPVPIREKGPRKVADKPVASTFKGNRRDATPRKAA